MKRQEWNDEKLEQILRQLPQVQDKRSSEDIYQRILTKQQNRKKLKTWIAPTFATVAAMFIFILFSPYLFQEITSSNQESSMDKATSSSSGEEEISLNNQEDESKRESSIMVQENDNAEVKLADLENNIQETFVTPFEDGSQTITIGLTAANADYIIPISVSKEHLNQPQQIQQILVENLIEKIGPVSFELQNTEILPQENPEEIILDYTGKPILSSSMSETIYIEAIQETFRWIGVNTVKFQTNSNAGIEFGNSGKQYEMTIQEKRQKAYLIYQYSENTSKLLVPSPESFLTIDDAIEIMMTGIPDKKLYPSVVEQLSNILITENDTQIQIEFSNGDSFQNNEQYILMLEAILLTAKEFGFKEVKFNGIGINKIGNMDVTKPVEVPFSPNPIHIN
ncbi:hypothetical protein JOC75_002469 [Metabacillus crassostreae]|uniref:hypothetical protein n=1 Tax=Metabacillus crassostreae TaxID=929098 RepID=UPI00195DC6CE|nr:hypothetical protein [Metabacillus crassostreae]MBM7604466.1 hypothetical protein [Metabacillus crassostreae]